MTTGKRALIVDDSRSARVILSRMLEQHALTVDTAESAEQALEYLQRNRPDVIFMDHLMPGMDGFQAVQAIKADALTATIPLLMYTSQEGELYVSQARALGAVGVLPKTVRPADVSRILYQLHLLPDRRTQRTTLFAGPAEAAARAAIASPGDAPIAAALAAGAVAEPTGPGEVPATPTYVAASTPVAPNAIPLTPELVSELQAALRQSTSQLVKDQLAEQRRFMLATFEAFARRLTGEVRDGLNRIPAAAPIELPPPAPRTVWPVVVTALLAVVPAAVLGYLLWQSTNTNAALNEKLASTQAAVERARAVQARLAVHGATAAPELSAVSSNAAPAAPAQPAGLVATEFVPYGETPFAGARLERLRTLAASLEEQGFKGRLRVESFVGDFCLSGNAGDGFTIADAKLNVERCDLVGNPFDDGLSSAQRQSVDFANYAATLRRRTGGAIVVEVVNAGRRRPIDYPQQDETTTAGAWNDVAEQNNRVEFNLLPGA